MTSIPAHARVSRKPDVIWTEIDGQTLLMSVAMGEYYGFDAIASDIWARLEKPVRVDDLVRDLTDVYQGDPAVIANDVRNLLETMAEKQLLQLEG